MADLCTLVILMSEVKQTYVSKAHSHIIVFKHTDPGSDVFKKNEMEVCIHLNMICSSFFVLLLKEIT